MNIKVGLKFPQGRCKHYVHSIVLYFLFKNVDSYIFSQKKQQNNETMNFSFSFYDC